MGPGHDEIENMNINDKDKLTSEKSNQLNFDFMVKDILFCEKDTTNCAISGNFIRYVCSCIVSFHLVLFIICLLTKLFVALLYHVTETLVVCLIFTIFHIFLSD